MARCNTILDAIGRTPVVRLHRLGGDLPGEVWTKVEALNPGGSSKDRAALAMIEAAEIAGTLEPGATIVEPTGGNTGVGLALIAAVKGYRCVLVVPAGTSREKLAVLRAYGAEVIEARTDVEPTHPEGFIGLAERIAVERGAFHPDQFENAANPRAHVATTAIELLEDLDGRIDAFVACVGSGGTIAGTGRALRAKLPAIRLVRVVPRAESGATGVSGAPTAVEGVSPFDPDPGFECPVVDEVVELPDGEAFDTARRLAREEGLLVGASSGAAVAAALQIAARMPRGARVVAFCPDTGRNYLSGFFASR